METINIRYGESVTLPLDTGGAEDVSADIYVGKPGEVFLLTQHITLTDGKGTFELTDTQTQIPIGEYFYQVNVTDSDGRVDKYPAPKDDCGECETDFPKFIVAEALDLTEVS